MKWLLVAVLLVLLVWTWVAYTIAPDPTADGKTVLTWVSGDNPARREAIRLFEERHPDIRVLLDPGNTGTEKIIIQCKAGIGPDVFNIYTWYHLYDYVRAGVVLPLDEYATEMGFGPDKTWPEIQNEVTVEQFNDQTDAYERRQYSFPANVNANVMFYNMRVFDEAGVEYPQGDWTWDECLEAARKLVKKDVRGRTIRYGIGTFDMLETVELVWQFGGRLFDPTLSYCVMDSPEAIEAITFLRRMILVDGVMPSAAMRDAIGTAGGWGGNLVDLFANGQLGMMRIGRWAMVKLRKYPDMRGFVGAVHLPYKREKVGIVRAMTVGINPKSPNKEASLKFLQFLASDEFSWQVVESADALPPSPRVARDPRFIEDGRKNEEDFNHLFAEAVERGRNLMFPPFIQGMRVQKIIDRYIALLSENKLTPEEMCRQLTAEINRDIGLSLTRYDKMRAEYKRRTGLDFDPANFPPREVDP